MYGGKMYRFPDLEAAHVANDKTVFAVYGIKPNMPKSATVAQLFGLYLRTSMKEG